MITRRDFLKVTAAGGALASFGSLAEAKTTLDAAIPDQTLCYESEREIPVIAETDLIVAGGSSRAIAAAVAAAKAGCKVYLIGSLPYFGDDICGSHLYDRQAGESTVTGLSRKLFPGNNYPTPLHVKKVLEDELIDNQIPFLYSSFVTNVLTDPSGKPAGVVIANRSGRQAIRAKGIIDATQTAQVARLLDVTMSDFEPGEYEFQYTVTGNSPKQHPAVCNTELLAPVICEGKALPMTRYTFRLPLQSNSYDALMQAEQQIRSATWDADQVDSSDQLWFIPQQTIQSKEALLSPVNAVRALPAGAFQPQQTDNVWVLGPCAEIPRETAAYMMRPLQAVFVGEILGEQAANALANQPMPVSTEVLQSTGKGSNYGRIGELLAPLRPGLNKGMVHSPAGVLPVLGNYDIVVLGGGTAGASAGISAAKQGANTLVLEYLHALGGLGTVGMIGRYWDGFREGYTAQMDKAVYAMAPADHPRVLPYPDVEFPADWKMEWYRKELQNAGADVWFGVLGCGALYDGNRIKGVVVATPYGRGVILSDILIDSTGSADTAIAAGAPFEYTGMKSLAVQGAGCGKWAPGDFYNNNDWLFVDDFDVLDVSRAFIQAKNKLTGQFDVVKMPQTRERRRITGDYTISVYDVINQRRYPDTISFHRSSFDTHGMIVDPLFMLNPPEKRHKIYDADVPLRSLLPKGMEGIIVTGLGASADRDAMPVIRMQPCLQNQGYAVGYLAATGVKENKPLRKVDLKKIQKHLVKIGNLPERVLTDKTFKGYSHAEMQKAAATVTDQYNGLEILLTDPARCKNLIAAQLRKTADPADRIKLAGILCMLGNDEYAGVLADAVDAYPAWDAGWPYTGMGQFGECLSPLDAMITALGRSQNTIGLNPVLTKARQLTPEDDFSHHRAIAMATESINSAQAIPVLVTLLTTPGMRYHSINSYEEARNKLVPDLNDDSTRNQALKELHIARALYLCGDDQQLGETVLRRYADGLQGHYARYATEILASNQS